MKPISFVATKKIDIDCYSETVSFSLSGEGYKAYLFKLSCSDFKGGLLLLPFFTESKNENGISEWKFVCYELFVCYESVFPSEGYFKNIYYQKKAHANFVFLGNNYRYINQIPFYTNNEQEIFEQIKHLFSLNYECVISKDKLTIG